MQVFKCAISWADKVFAERDQVKNGKVKKEWNCIMNSATLEVGKLEKRNNAIVRKVVNMMLATLRAKNQITLPGEIIKKLKLKKDDNVDIEVNDSGQIIITPVAIIEKQFITDLKEALDDIEKGNVSEAMSAEEIIKKLGL